MSELEVGAEIVNINQSSRNMFGLRGVIIGQSALHWQVEYHSGKHQNYRKDTAHIYIKAVQTASHKGLSMKPMQPTNLTGNYIIWSPSGTHNPRVVHGTWDVADGEARRLTMQHDQVFYVAELKAKYSVEVTKTVKAEF